MNDMFWAAMPLVMAAYFFGIKIGRVGMSHEPTIPGGYAKHWYICVDCTPGVTYKIGADTRDHLAQVIQWHEDDHHGEEEECSDTTDGATSLHKRLALWSRLQSSIYGEAAQKLWLEKVVLPPFRSADLPATHGSIADISGPAPTALQKRVANVAMGLMIVRH